MVKQEMTKEAKPSKFEALLEEAAQQLRIGDLYRWTRVEMGKDLNEMPEVLRLSPIFFRLTFYALSDESILHLTRLLEDRKETLNLHAMKRWLRKNPECIPGMTADQVRREVLPKLETEIKDIQRKVRKIVDVRDNEIAHLNLERLMAKHKVDGVKYSEIEEAYQSVHQLLDWLSEKCFKQPIGMIEIFGSEDFPTLLEMAKVGLESKLKRLARRSEVAPVEARGS